MVVAALWSDLSTLRVLRRGFTRMTRTPDIKRVNGVHPMSCDQCLQIVGFFGPHHVPICEKHMQTWRISVSALLHAAVTSFV